MLSRSAFISAIKKIRVQEAAVEEFNMALRKLSDGITTFDIDNQYLEALRDVLSEAMHDTGDWIGWWLFEASDYMVSWDEDGKEVSVNLEDVNDLYDFMVNNAVTLTDEQLPITDMQFDMGVSPACAQKSVDYCEYTNCFDRITHYVRDNNVALHITENGESQYVLMNTKMWNQHISRSSAKEG